MATDYKHVCADCFEDAGIRDFIELNSMDARCKFCFSTQDSVAVASLHDVVEHIESSLLYEWDNADNWLPYESREGGYQGYWVDTEELLRFETELELSEDVDNELMKQIVDLISDYAWCEENPLGINDKNRFEISWENFCDTSKCKNRYVLENYNDDFEYDSYSPVQILDKFFEYAELYGLFKTVPATQTLFRARFQDGETELTTPQELGPPPRDKATQSNRMSRAGFPMFYGSDDIETALREIVYEEGTYAIGLFKTRRDMTILDLTQIPPIPSLFQAFPETLGYRPREVLRFLNHIAAEISKPIERDEKVHINYVPTQVVTEFVRSKLTSSGQRIDGIKYGSAVHKGHASYVIFATQDNLVISEEDRWGTTSNRWLELASKPVTRWISSETILKWKEERTRSRLSDLPIFDSVNLD